MKITCHSCGAKYTIADSKVSGRRVKVRCRSCGTPIVVDGQQPEAGGFSQPDLFDQGPVSSADISDRLSSIEIDRPEPEGWSVNLSDTDQRTMSTAEIVDGFRNGVLSEDAYVWRDGMADWQPVLDVAELREAIQKQRTSAASVPRRSQPAPSSARGGQTPLAARVSGGRARGGTDLFGSVESAGSETEALQEAAPSLLDQRPSGARNENSVLFSLDALKAGFAAPAPPPPRAQTLPQDFSVSNDDPFGMSKGNSGLSGIAGSSNALFSFDNQALLTAPAAPPPREPERPVASAMDVAPSAASAPLAMPKKAASKPMIAIGAALVLLLIVGIVVALSGGSDEPEVAKTDTPAETKPADKPAEPVAAANKPADKPAPAKEPEPAKTDPAPQPTPEASAAPSPAVEKPPVTDEDKKRFAESQQKKKENAKPVATKKEEDKPAAPAGGDGPPFSRGAAVAALSSAASAASGCKKAGGPTGSGKVVVTFAPSGRVTSANVAGGSFGGTSVGGCVASVFRRAKVPAFGGGPVTVSKSFSIR